jgi:signal transduction histidine kinase
MFRLFAELIAMHLDAQEKLERSEAALLDERQTAQLREQFIAVLGHDLRNPLASLMSGLRLLRNTPLDAKATTLVGMMQNSCSRMAGLITNVLDFARGRLGGGITLNRRTDDRLGPILQQVVDELSTVWPGREIEASIDVTARLAYDPERSAQLFSNLLANALTHGAADSPVRVSAKSGADGFELSVANAGDPIPQEAMARLFQPFARATNGGPKAGLGLGLYIAAEIAQAHGGSLDVSSTKAETKFTFRMPVPA